MDEIITALKALIENPDDLSQLPQLITELENIGSAFATREADDLARITSLQDANRNLLSQIPISTGPAEPEPVDDEPTFEDAQQEMLKALENSGGY